jgi:REP element-mobilizing transposase RayT
MANICRIKMTHGGFREGAGRKRRSKNSVPHTSRPEFDGEYQPLHITLRMAKGVWNLRSQRGFKRVAHALRAEQQRAELRITHYSVQGNHIHMIAETPDRPTLSRRMQGFSIRLAKAINRMMGRPRGRVLRERYHVAVLRSSRRVFNTIRYVLLNHVHHYRADAEPDRFSSETRGLTHDACVWMLTTGWKRYGPIRGAPDPAPPTARRDRA